jgi:tRNA(adenine34) deaminase
MELALEQAELAADQGDVPVGAVLFDSETGDTVSLGHNRREIDKDPTAHAEVLALRTAAERLGQWRLTGLTMVVTLEPCVMCAGALVNARLDRVVFGAFDIKAGAMGSLYHVGVDPRLNHSIDTIGGFGQERCSGLLTDFFAAKRDAAPDPLMDHS